MAKIKANSTESRARTTRRYTLPPKLLSGVLSATKLQVIPPCLLQFILVAPNGESGTSKSTHLSLP
ncbi:hypothetical protein BN874_750014 [Candidatus Contendobacter odensis Run_B_J11]|uniref:Uncharacterized protein n=1 Tax=Candidatus Contendobacter odensis Run_B_J11 TaxID=1400861 RepID=A0A7U7J5D2_9GAMM|nr:hypothetical protein BN874_750014 [Candidatus Contendobacter odensis Run_B_J11]